MRPPNKESLEVYQSFQVIKFACLPFLCFCKETLSPWCNLKQRRIQIACIQCKVLKHKVLNPHRKLAIGV